MLKHMKAHKHLKPGEPGTVRLVERFGDRLICVRYRYDAIRGTVLVQVPFTMKALRDRPKGVGAKWDQEQKLWRVQWGLIRGDRELVERVVKG